jgi:phosphomannomutase / phosphoglucomutase
MIDAGIFKKYDIRGRAEGENPPVTPAAAHLIGRALAAYLQSREGQARVVVGRDNRRSSPELQAALMDGLRISGCEVIDLGLVATPVVYWHAVYHEDCGGVMITGSHLASDQNGFKLSVGSRNLYGDDLQALRAIITNEGFETGSGSIIADTSAHSRYIDDLAARIPPSTPLRVVIDAGNGVGGLFAPRLVEKWGHMLVECLYCEPDASYPNHHPNPQEPQNMHDLGMKVRETGADVGIAFDGDADRMGAVDENGHMIAADRLLALLARDMLGRHPGAAVVADVLSSQVLFDVVEAAGGRAYMAASGHALVKEMLREKGALLGGEMSGHIFLAENYFRFDDGFLAAGRLLQLIAATGQSLSALDDGLPRLYSTPEYRPHCPDEDKAAVIQAVAEKLADRGEVETVDGLRIRFERGWGLLRASNTEPVLSLRFEGESEADALEYRDLFAAALTEFPQVAPLE